MTKYNVRPLVAQEIEKSPRALSLVLPGADTLYQSPYTNAI